MNQNLTDPNGSASPSQNEDPMLARSVAYEAALKGLPKGLRGSISEYVKQHVNMAMAPAPVTKASARAHLLLCLASFLGIWGITVAVQELTSGRDTVPMLALPSFAQFASMWLVSAALSSLVRVQTREFRISAVFVSVNLGVLFFLVARYLGGWIELYLRPSWLGAAAAQMACASVIFYWLHWYLRAILPTSRPFLVRRLSVVVSLMVTVGILANSYHIRDDYDELPEMHVQPIGLGLLPRVDMDELASATLADAVTKGEKLAERARFDSLDLIRDRKFKRALASIDYAIGLKPGLDADLLARAEAKLGMNDSAGAIVDLLEYLKAKGPRRAQAVNLMVKAHLHKGDLPGAVQVLARETATGDKTEFSGRAMLGVLLFYSGDRDGALRELQAVSEVKEISLWAALWLEYGLNRVSTGRLDEPSANLIYVKAGRRWPGPAVQLIRGTGTVEEMLKAVTMAGPDQKLERKCQGEFVRAEWERRNFADAKAIAGFRAVRELCSALDWEWHLAALELKRLEKRR